MKPGYAALVLLVALNAGVAVAQQTLPPVQVGITERLGETVPLDVELYNDSGQVVTLRHIIDKPTIVTFVYYRCPGICTPALNELTRVVNKMGLELGKDYQILTLSFDHRETPDIASDKRENYLAQLNGPVNPSGWRFYTGDSTNIQRFTSSAGFYFQKSGNDWVHATALIVLSPEGKITRYINGIQYLPFDVKMAVIEASNGKVGPTISKVLNFCFSYDPESHRYALNFLRVSLLVILVLVGIFVVFVLLKPKAKGA